MIDWFDFSIQYKESCRKNKHNEPSHQDLCCLTFSLSTLHINFFPKDSLLKNKRKEKFGTERIQVMCNKYTSYLEKDRNLLKIGTFLNHLKYRVPIVSIIQGNRIYLVDFCQFRQGRQLLRLPVSFTERQILSEKGLYYIRKILEQIFS